MNLETDEWDAFAHSLCANILRTEISTIYFSNLCNHILVIDKSDKNTEYYYLSNSLKNILANFMMFLKPPGSVKHEKNYIGLLIY